MFQILVINPGSTSTKIALFDDEVCRIQQNLQHPVQELEKYTTVPDQLEFRLDYIVQFLEDNHIDLESIDAIVGRGGLLEPIPGGTFLINEQMLYDLNSSTYGQHASNLGGILAHHLAQKVNKPAYIVDPVVVDELSDIARLSGHPEMPRKSIFHALNHKAVAKRAAKELALEYDKNNFIVAHLGGGISVGAHYQGRVCDVNNALDGDGPYSPERSGTLPVGTLVRQCFADGVDQKTIFSKIKGKGGLAAYLGTNDIPQIKEKIKNGNKQAELYYFGMAYQISKEIAAMAAVLKGKVEAILLTGGIAYNDDFVDYIKESVSFIAPVLVYPGEEELLALAKGALAVLRDEEQVKLYG